MLVLKRLVGLHGTVQLQLLQHYWLGHRLRLPWYWMVYLGNKQKSFCEFWVPWTEKRFRQSILKEISPGCSLEGLMLKLKLQYFGHLMRRADSFEKTLMLGKIEDRKIRGCQRNRWLDGIIDSMDMSFGNLREFVMVRESSRAVPHGVTKSQTGLSDWIELNWRHF